MCADIFGQAFIQASSGGADKSVFPLRTTVQPTAYGWSSLFSTNDDDILAGNRLQIIKFMQKPFCLLGQRQKSS